MLSFDNVSKFILSQVTLHIPQGTSVGIVGAVGAGKTTLLRLACGLLEADKGEVFIDGDVQKNYSKDVSRGIGVLFTDKPVFNAEESITANFETLRNIYRLKNNAFVTEYRYLSEKLGFDKFEHEKVKNLSLGQRRRAEIGAVLIHNPKVLIMDEPTNGLDANAKEAFKDILNECTKSGMTVVLSSHDLVSISSICQRIAILDKGKLLYYGGEEMLLKQFVPIDIMTLKLAGALPDLEDLPLERLYIEKDIITIVYNSNHITAAEILRNIVSQTGVKEVNISKPDLTDAILKIQKGNEDE